MKYEYQLHEDDYMQYLLYSTSRSKKVVKRRSLNKLMLMIIYVITGLFLYNRNGPIASAAFFLLCIPLYFLYGYFERKQYHKHFLKFIRDQYKEWMNKPITFEITDNVINIRDEDPNHLSPPDIEWIAELPSEFILQSKEGKAFIVPRNKVDDLPSFTSALKAFAAAGSAEYRDELKWKWK